MTTRHLLAAAAAGAALLVTISAAACGGATYADKCELACAPPEGPCANEDAAACEDACGVATEGLSVLCAQCIVEHSEWSGVTCDAQGCKDFFGSGGTSGDCEPCTAADEHCSGFDLEKTTSSSCKTICAGT